MADIFFSDINRFRIYQLPVLPEEMPELTMSCNNETFETFNNGTFNFIGNTDLITFSLESWLPSRPNKYSWVKSDILPYALINLWVEAMNRKEPLRIVINRSKEDYLPKSLLNWLVTIENMSWHELNNGDVAYKLDLKQYREIK
ncbi:TPA: hypothetical protein PTV45_000595 [Clostridium botulinum]|nr:hypothetical protein [Clostridium botulinum]